VTLPRGHATEETIPRPDVLRCGISNRVYVGSGSQPEELNVSITSLLIPRKLTSQRTCADFRFVPIATERSATKKLYSITSSAIESTSGGIVRPSALAVFMLMTSSNLLDCTTGRSAGIAPFKTLAA
jgi:hypothetical protein